MPIERTDYETHLVKMPLREYKVACQVATRIGRAASGNAIIMNFMDRIMSKWTDADPRAEDLAKYWEMTRSAGPMHEHKLRLPTPIYDRIRAALAHLPPEWTFEKAVEAVVQWSMEDMRTSGPLQGRHF